MKEEDPLTPEEILKDALPAIDGPEFEHCGAEFKKDLRWAVLLNCTAHARSFLNKTWIFVSVFAK